MNETSNANLTQLHKECRKRKANPHEQIPQHGVIVEKKNHKRKAIGENSQDTPVTKSNPDGSCFKNTTLFPLNLPVRMIRTVPGVILDLQIV